MLVFALAALILPQITGALNPQVTPQTIRETICVKGWTATVRPSSSYTSALKRQQLQNYQNTDPSAYEEDHLVPLELGGAPTNPNNLWPQPWAQARADDRHENRYRQLVCAGTWGLNYARRADVRFKETHG